MKQIQPSRPSPTASPGELPANMPVPPTLEDMPDTTTDGGVPATVPATQTQDMTPSCPAEKPDAEAALAIVAVTATAIPSVSDDANMKTACDAGSAPNNNAPSEPSEPCPAPSLPKTSSGPTTNADPRRCSLQVFILQWSLGHRHLFLFMDQWTNRLMDLDLESGTSTSPGCCSEHGRLLWLFQACSARCAG